LWYAYCIVAERLIATETYVAEINPKETSMLDHVVRQGIHAEAVKTFMEAPL